MGGLAGDSFPVTVQFAHRPQYRVKSAQPEPPTQGPCVLCTGFWEDSPSWLHLTTVLSGQLWAGTPGEAPHPPPTVLRLQTAHFLSGWGVDSRGRRNNPLAPDPRAGSRAPVWEGGDNGRPPESSTWRRGWVALRPVHLGQRETI